MRLFAHRRAGWAVILFVAVFGCAKDESVSSDGTTGERLKNQSIRLLDLDGQPFDLFKSDPSIVTVVLFTRTDCPISNRCAPEICRLYEAYHARGVEFFLIYVDASEQPDEIRRHLQEYGYPCQALRDPKHKLVAFCEATATPEAVVFAKDGRMAYRGRVDDQYADLGKPRAAPTTRDLSDAIESTLLDRPVANPRTKAIGCSIADVRD